MIRIVTTLMVVIGLTCSVGSSQETPPAPSGALIAERTIAELRAQLQERDFKLAACEGQLRIVDGSLQQEFARQLADWRVKYQAELDRTAPGQWTVDDKGVAVKKTAAAPNKPPDRH